MSQSQRIKHRRSKQELIRQWKQAHIRDLTDELYVHGKICYMTYIRYLDNKIPPILEFLFQPTEESQTFRNALRNDLDRYEHKLAFVSGQRTPSNDDINDNDIDTSDENEHDDTGA